VGDGLVEVVVCDVKALGAKGAEGPQLRSELQAVLRETFCDQSSAWISEARSLLDSASSGGRKHAWIVLALLRETVVGAAVVDVNRSPVMDTEATIRMLATHPAHRRCGFGRLLDGHIHLHARRQGLSRVCVEVSRATDQHVWRECFRYEPFSSGASSGTECHACIFKNTELLVKTTPESATGKALEASVRGLYRKLRVSARPSGVGI